MADVESLRMRLRPHGQEHLLQFWDQLDEVQRRELVHDIDGIDFAEVNRFFRHTMESSSDEEKLDERLQPIPSQVLGAITRTNDQQLRHYEDLAMAEISKGRVAALLLGGGQGTRLGATYPKGMYDVGLPSRKSLYQLQGERLVKLQQLARERNGAGEGGAITWYIMTSDHTKEPTLEFLRRHHYFGLDEDDVVVFEQGNLPCFTNDGKIILESKSHVAKAPDGNGGLYRALRDQRILEDMDRRGIEYVHVYCVDNILVKMADPVFLGYCLSKGADCAAKVVEKAFPTEAVGVVCQVDGRYQVVEYSEITLSTAQKRNADGRLTFNAGNICNHFFTKSFLKGVISGAESTTMTHHVARKKIAHVDASGAIVKPDKPNGIKLEQFVFDVFQFAKNFAVWEVLREDEFSPLKNADGADKDTPTTARMALSSLHQRQILAAGGQFVDAEGAKLPLIPSSLNATNDKTALVNETNNNDIQKCGSRRQEPLVCEISPLVSYAGEGLDQLVRGKQFCPPLLLSAATENTNGVAH